MARIEIVEDRLKIEILGWDKLWSFKSRFDIPIENVSDVRVGNDLPKFGFRGWRAPGTCLPGILVAGSYYKQGKWTFWDVHDMKNAIEIDLQNERYAMLMIETEDREAAIKLIREWISPAPVPRRG
jgi:hypothetical protein